MKKYAIDLDITKCISCGACSVACMDQNDFQVKEGQRPFRNVFDLEMEQKGNVKYSHLSLACMHCSDAPCISACPSACLKKDPETNLTVYDTTNCIGCHSCAMVWYSFFWRKWQDDQMRWLLCKSPSWNASGLRKSLSCKSITVSGYRSKRASDSTGTFFKDDKCGNAEAAGVRNFNSTAK